MKSTLKDYVNTYPEYADGYEYISFKFIDTVTESEVAQNRIQIMSNENAECRSQIQVYSAAIKGYEIQSYSFTKSDIARRKESIKYDEDKISKNKKDSTELSLKINNKTIVGYIACHKCKINNPRSERIEVITSYLLFDKQLESFVFSSSISEARSMYLDINTD